MDYLMFKNGIDSKGLENKLLSAVMYSSEISNSGDSVSISIKAGDEDGTN